MLVKKMFLRDIDRAKLHMALGVGKSSGISLKDTHTFNMDSHTSIAV